MIIGVDESKEFRCCMCGGTFEKVRSDDEAIQECMARKSTRHLTMAELEEGLGSVCDDCFQKLPEELRR